jgi:putative transposase
MHDPQVTRQCRTLSLAHSTAYYRPQEASEADVALMRRIGELRLEHPFAGSRMLRDMLQREDHRIGRKHVSTRMKKMGPKTLYKAVGHPRRLAARKEEDFDRQPRPCIEPGM